MPESYHLLHVFPSFEVGGVQVRTSAIINRIDRRFRHTIIALNGDYGCAERLAGEAPVDLLTQFEPPGSLLGSLISAARMIARIQPDMLLTYNWASVDWSLMHAIRPACVHIHHEDGFGADEAMRQFTRRVAYRRLSLWRNDLLIVPSQNLDRIARDMWRRPAAKIQLIPNGIDWRAFASNVPPPPPDAARPTVLGTVAPLRAEKNIAAILRIAANLRARHPIEVAIVGDGPERRRLETVSAQLGLTEVCRFPGLSHDVAGALAAIDIFMMPSLTEQMPISLLQAMAAAKPVVAYDVGDISRMVCQDNAPYIVTRNDEAALLHGAEALVENPEQRRGIGDGNLARVKDQYTESAMIERYTAAYCDVLAIDR